MDRRGFFGTVLGAVVGLVIVSAVLGIAYWALKPPRQPQMHYVSTTSPLFTQEPPPLLVFEGIADDPTQEVVITYSEDYRDLTFSANWSLTDRLCVPEGCLTMEELRTDALTRASGGR